MVKKQHIGIIIVAILIIIGAIFAYNSYSSDSDVISIGYQPSDHDAALFVANASGMFTDAGLKVELHEYSNGGDLMSAMASGDVDVGYVGITPFLSSKAKGVPVKIVAGVQTEGSGIVAKDSSITSLSDLKGKTVATIGDASIQHMLLQYALEEEGMSLSDVNAPSMNVATLTDALRNGKIDAMVTPEPYVSIAENNGGYIVERSGEIIENHPCCVVAMSDDFLNKHPDLAKQYIEIQSNATQKLIDDANGSVQYLPSSIVPNATLEQTTLSNMNWVVGLNDTYKQNIRDFIDIENKLGVLNKTFTDDELFYVAE
ncbi:ABC transporter substrate-binding protein [Methanosphaera sp.]